MKVLFLGNSFTYFNDLPGLFSDLSRKSGVTVDVESITKGGASLREFLNPENQIGARLQELLSEPWDAVVFQEQSFRPVGNPESFLSAARELSRRFPESRRYFYQTWAYRDCSEKLASKEISYSDMYQGLKRAYSTAAEENGGILVPVGDGFYRIWKDGSKINLYRPDDFHPSAEGTYLAACYFAKGILGIDPLILPDLPDLSPESAKTLREISSGRDS